MPSIKNPLAVVHPGPGRLPANTVTASAFVFPGGGGSSAALTAHINDPMDAHMAGAIGIPPVNPITGEPLLASNVPPGVIDGESVLDFIAQFKDLIPTRPPYLGMSGLNTGVPSWGTLDTVADGGTSRTAGFDDGAGHALYTRYEVPTGTSTFTISGNLYPADRGVLALYKNTAAPLNNFANPFSGATLVAALYLGTTTPPSPMGVPTGIPVAGFDESLRPTLQPDYTASNTGIDLISLGYRYPYLTSYPAGVPYTPFSGNFTSFQLARYSVVQSVAAGDNQSWFLVHWRDSFATSLTAISPGSLTLGSLSAANCFSAVPSTAADFDDSTKSVFNLNRHNVFRNTASATSTSLNALTVSLAANTHKLSGVSFYDRTGPVAITYEVTYGGLFSNSFLLGSTSPIPTDYQTTDPLSVGLTEFGTTDRSYRYDQLDNGVTTTLFSATNPPATGSLGRIRETSLGLTTIPYTKDSRTAPWSVLSSTGRNVHLSTTDTSATKFLLNTWDAVGGAGAEGGYDMETFEKFVDESYRYVFSHVPSASDPIKPSGMSAHNSSLPLSVDTASLQVIGGRLTYPQIDFSAADFRPTGQPNYSTIPLSDPAQRRRRYLRAINTGVARNTGKIRIRGLAYADFMASLPFDGNDLTGHLTGGAVIHLLVPGSTGWLDLGRAYGTPTVGTDDFYGCSTGVLVEGSDVTVSYQTGNVFTADNGSGDFPLFVRVTFLNSVAGRALSLEELEWLPF